MSCAVLAAQGAVIFGVVDGKQITFKLRQDRGVELCIWSPSLGCDHITLSASHVWDLRVFLSPNCPWLGTERKLVP